MQLLQDFEQTRGYSHIFERYCEMINIKETIDRIRHEIFLHKYNKQYIGVDIPEMHILILYVTTKNLTSIKA